MIDLRIVIGYIAGLILVPAYLIIIIVSLVTWVSEKGTPVKQKTVEQDRHIYYPVRYSRKLKTLFTIDAIGLAVFILPILPAVIADAAFGINPLIAWAVAAAFWFIVVILLAKKLDKGGSKVECVIVDSEGFTVRCPDAVQKYSIRDYEGFVNGGKNNPFHLVFGDNSGNKVNVYLPFLAAGEPLEIGQLLNKLKQS